MNTVLEVTGLVVQLGDAVVLDHLDLVVHAGEAVAILGPSGSGKTTLLNAVAGFIRPASGSISIAGATVTDERRRIAPEHRSVAMVFQNYALWPHLSALDTVAYPLRRAGLDAGAAAGEARRLLDRVGIGALAHRRPSELSGGQQQRVGLARALARRPALYLFDEPTAHLDAALRRELEDELTEQRTEAGGSALYATHDPAEALGVADRVALLRSGRIAQVGTPRGVYERPVDADAAALTGPAGILEGVVVDQEAGALGVEVAGLRYTIGGAPEGLAGRLSLLVRPEWVRPGPGVDAVVRRSAYRGPHYESTLDTPAGRLTVRTPDGPLSRGTRISVTIERLWPLGATAAPA